MEDRRRRCANAFQLVQSAQNDVLEFIIRNGSTSTSAASFDSAIQLRQLQDRRNQLLINFEVLCFLHPEPLHNVAA
jgi:hypothetical protein